MIIGIFSSWFVELSLCGAELIQKNRYFINFLASFFYSALWVTLCGSTCTMNVNSTWSEEAPNQQWFMMSGFESIHSIFRVGFVAVEVVVKRHHAAIWHVILLLPQNVYDVLSYFNKNKSRQRYFIAMKMWSLFSLLLYILLWRGGEICFVIF